MATPDFSFNVEWLADTEQHYHGPRQRMRKALAQCQLKETDILDQESALRWLVNAYADCVPYFQKVKFYRLRDDASNRLLRFYILWCGDSVAVRERMFEDGAKMTSATEWYPVVTGRRYFHHQNEIREATEGGLRKAMNRTAIERQPGLGSLIDVTALAKSGGTSILLRTTTSDIVLDAGLAEAELRLSELRPGVRKWLFISHAHGDHIGGSGVFIKDKKFVVAVGAITLELLLASLSRSADLMGLSRKSSSIGSPRCGTAPVTSSRTAHRFNRSRLYIDVGIIEAAFVGRKIGLRDDDADSIISSVSRIIENGRHALLLTPPGDYGLYLFLHLYDRVIAKATRTIDAKLFLDPLILQQLALIEWRMKRKQVGSLDDACRAWLAGRATLGESVRVFDFAADPAGNVDELVRRRMRGVFILNDRLAGSQSYFPNAARERLESDGLEVLLIGKAATIPRDDDSQDTRESFGAGPWLLHSSETELAKYLLAGPQRFSEVYLFHNFGRRLERFSKTLIDRGFAGTIRVL